MILKKLQDRFTVTMIAFVLVFSIIILRLTSIMIVDGATYREDAENRIFKSISLAAPRGEIRDRYGRLLAGNRPSFTVQIMKNEIANAELNEVALKLMNIFEKNGDSYVDDFPIVINEDGSFEFTYDRSITEWKEANDIPLEATGKETYEILFERYGIEATDAAEAQQQLLQHMTVPVSIQTWKYTDQMKKEDWLKSHQITDFEISAQEAFDTVREKYYKIPETYSREEAKKIMIVREQLNKVGYLQFQPIRIAQDVSEQTVVDISERIIEFPGVSIATEPIRFYPEGMTAAHILGTLGKISQQSEIDYFIKELGYNPSDIIGKTGIEHSFEERLKGKDGSQKVIVDSRGRLVEVLEREEPIPGETLYLTIDMNLQRKAEEVLKEVLETLQAGGTYTTQWGSNRLMSSKSGPMINATSGAVVVLDVKTGEVLALANYPAYDPNLFSTGISQEDWNSLLPENERDPLAPRPQLNIALSTAIQPGSTFKMLVGIAALEKGLSPEYKILDRGSIKMGGHSFGNWLYNQGGGTMGWQNLYQAIAHSNNYYFYSLGAGYDFGIERPLPVDVGVKDIIDYSIRFGLNDRTGIEIQVPRERSGGVPSEENKTRTIVALLRRYLERQLKPEDFVATQETVTQERIETIIDEIVGWTLENPSRGAIYNRLKDFGMTEGSASLYADMIKYTYFNQAKWSPADVLNFSIGQGEHSYTPLQMANFMAMIANGGYRNPVSVVQKLVNYNGQVSPVEKAETVRVEMNDYDHLKDVAYGMLQTTVTGGAKAYFTNFPVQVAGKTGTAQRSGKIPPLDEVEYLLSHLRSFGVTESAVYQRMEQLREENPDDVKYRDDAYAMAEAIKSLNPKIKNVDLDQFKRDYDNYAWFTGFAPYDNPEIAVSVLLFQGGSGGYAAPIFREIVAEYMGLNLEADEAQAVTENRLTR